MNGKRLLSLLLCLILCMTTLFAYPVHADFGDYAGDDDYGGYDDYDYGGYDDDYDYDYNDDDDYDYDYGRDYDDNDNYDYGGSSYDGGSYGGSASALGGPFRFVFVSFAAQVLFTGIMLVGLVLFLRKLKKTRRSAPQSNVSRPVAAAPRQLRSMQEYAHLDPGFDAQAFSAKLANLYVQMQNSWQSKNIENLRPYFTDTLYAQMDRQLDALRRNCRTNYVERITVLGVRPLGFCQSGGVDTIVVELRTRIVDYTLDDRTGQLISGSRQQEKFMTYEWELSRPTGTTTARQAEMTSVSCPHCGAALNINQSAKCPYCDSVVTLEQHDWAISAIRGISQKTK